MPDRLRYVDPDCPPGPFSRMYAALADRVFAPYAAYRREAAKANRTIPIVQLTPRQGGDGEWGVR